MMIRKLFFQKPLALTLSLFLLTLFLLLYTSFSHTLALAFGCLGAALSLLLGLVWLLCHRLPFGKASFRKALPVFLLLLSAVSLAFFLAAYTESKREQTISRYADTEAEATVAVHAVTDYGTLLLVTGEMQAYGEEACDVAVKALLFEHTVLEIGTVKPGDLLCGRFAFSETPRSSLAELGDYADGISLSAEAVSALSLAEEKAGGLAVHLGEQRAAVDSFLGAHLNEEGYGMIKALLLADKSGLSRDVRQNYSDLGIGHLFAVSGLHLSLLIGFLAFLLKKATLPRRLSYPLLAVVILFYMALTAFSPSLMRSGGMLLLFYLSYFCGHRHDSVTALLTATSCIVLLSPTSVLDLGLLLSFSSTLGILWIATPILKALNQAKALRSRNRLRAFLLLRPLKALASSLTITLAATAGSLVFLYLSYGRLFLLSFLSNLLFTPLITLLILLMPLIFLLAPFAFLSRTLAYVIEGVTSLMQALASHLAPLSFFNISLDYPFMPFLILLCLALVFLLIAFRPKHRMPLLPLLPILLFFLLAPLGIALDDRKLENSESLLYTTDTVNDALLLTYEDKGLFVDISQSALFRREAMESITAHSASIKPDTLLLTHVTAAHLKSVADLIDRYAFSCLILPDGYENSAALAAYAENAGLTVLFYTVGDTLLWNSLTLTTYAGQTSAAVAAIEISLDTQNVLYLKENAPDLYDIRFGPMTSFHDTVILGASGAACVSRPLTPKASCVVQGTPIPTIRPTDHYRLVYGTYFWSDE